MKKRKILIGALSACMLLGAGLTMGACTDNEWDGYLEVTNRAELVSAIENEEVDKIKVVEGDYGSAIDYENIVINRPVTIKGAGEEKPTIFGSIIIELENNETEEVVIENLEISHSGLYVTNAGTSEVDFTKDGRRGILIRNGGATIINNDIHLTDEDPEVKYTTAPTGIQISVFDTNDAKEELSYVIENNEIGRYEDNQHTAGSNVAGILIAQGGPNVADYGQINITIEEAYAIYDSNTFDSETDCMMTVFDYQLYRYVAGVFDSMESVYANAGTTLTYIADGKTVVPSDGVYKILDEE